VSFESVYYARFLHPASKLHMQLRRSVLFTPALNERAVRKAQTLPADVIILDLEDSVLPESKVAARAAAKLALESYDFGYSEVFVRINAVDTEWWQDDIASLSGTGVQTVVLPKVETRSDIAQISRVMASVDNGPGNVWIMLETPAGILNATELCGYGVPVAGVLVGTADLGKALQLPLSQDRAALTVALSTCVLAARAAGIVALDGVFMDVTDTEGLAAECAHGRALGFDGKSLVHPAQLETTNRLFAPDPAAVAAASALVAAWQASKKTGKGVCLYQGRLVEQLHVGQAQSLLAMAAAVADREAAK